MEIFWHCLAKSFAFAGQCYPHFSHAVMERVQKLIFDPLLYPLYSPDLTLYHFHFFLKIKDLHRNKYNYIDEESTTSQKLAVERESRIIL